MLNRTLSKFLKNTSGNVAAIFAIAALPLVMTVGGAIDMQRVNQSKIKLQSAADAGTLAAASFRNNGASTEEFVKEYIEANIGDDNNFSNLQVEIVDEEVTGKSRTITIKAQAEVPMSFLQLAGFETSVVEANSTAIESRSAIEYSLVLDISSSMAGDKIKNLKKASREFVDEVLSPGQKDTTSINLVPFGGSVNLGKQFKNYVVRKNRRNQNPSSAFYDRGTNTPYSKFRFTDRSRSLEGKECIELTRNDYDLDDLPRNTRGQIPHFFVFQKFNSWCPDAKSAAVWNSNDAKKLKKRISQISLSDGTGMDHGTLWGAKALSPSMRGKLGGNFSDRPSDFNDGFTKKVIVVMSDGAITGQRRPRDYRFFTTTDGKRVKTEDRPIYYNIAVKVGGIRDNLSKPTSSAYFKKVCGQLKAKGVFIYTIGFQIDADSKEEKMLQYCASNPANYFLVESLDIGQAFRAIIASVNKLRVSG